MVCKPIFQVIDRRGIELLREYHDVELPWYSSYKDLSDAFLQHTKLLNDTVAKIYRACRDAGYEVKEKMTEAELKAQRERVKITRVNGSRQEIPFNPDSFLVIVAESKRLAFFIEADRGTEKGITIKEKIRAYHAYFDTGAYTEHYGSQAAFRVLFVTNGDKRLDYLVRWAEEIDAGPNFWFTHIKSISRQSVLVEPIWNVAGWGQEAAILKSD